MGLAVEVGMLADLLKNDSEGAEWLRQNLQKVNTLLAGQCLPAHDEPELLPPLNCRCELESFPYSFLHYLRRFYARLDDNPDWEPVPVSEGEDPADDPVVEDRTMMFESHLLCHSDCEGFYLPLDFDDILSSDDIPGSFVGSSYRLQEELVQIAPKLNIQLSGSELRDTEVDRINSLIRDQSEFWVEKGVWLNLFEACRLSIQYKSVICFT